MEAVIVVLLIALVICFCCTYCDRKEIDELKSKIEAYDQSDKVIKNCVVYSPDEPITISGSKIAFIECTFESMNRTPATKALREYLGLK